MLGLKLVTEPLGNIVESNIEEILTDHAWCEQRPHQTLCLIKQNSEKKI
jgi:tRNA-(ms[2]io[6]A)-hydroxylase